VILLKGCDFGNYYRMSTLIFSLKPRSPEELRMSKEDIGRQGLSDTMLLEELQSFVIGDGVDLVSMRGQSL
jgi:hypothetical protein